MLIEELLELTVKEKASDLHVSANLPPVIRVSGNLVRTDYPPLTPEEVEALLFPMLSNEQRRTLEQVWELDMSYGIHGLGRFRVNIYKDKGNYAAAFRTINSVAPKFEDLGLPPIVRKITERPRGLILVTGPTGSGKSTTLASMIDHINKSRTHSYYRRPDRICSPIEKKYCSPKRIGTRYTVVFKRTSFSTS